MANDTIIHTKDVHGKTLIVCDGSSEHSVVFNFAFSQVANDVIDALVADRKINAMCLYVWAQRQPSHRPLTVKYLAASLGMGNTTITEAKKVLMELGVWFYARRKCAYCSKIAAHTNVVVPHPSVSAEYLTKDFVYCCSTCASKGKGKDIENTIFLNREYGEEKPYSQFAVPDSQERLYNNNSIYNNNESSNEDSIPPKRTRSRRNKPEGFNVTKRERKPKKSTELTKHVLVLDQFDDEERPITKVEFDKIYDFVQKQKIALTEEELHAWLELNKAKLGLKIKTKRGVLRTIKNWVAGFTEAERWKLDKHLGKNTGQRSGRRTQRLNGNISAKHTESEIRVPPHLRKLMDKES